MDIGDEHFNEVYQLLFIHTQGLSFEELWNKCKSFTDKIDVSKCIHRAIQQGNIRKITSTNTYELTDEKYMELSGGIEPPKKATPADPVTEEIKEYLHKNPKISALIDQLKIEEAPKVTRARVFSLKTKRTEVPKIENKEEVPFGNLQRSKALGAAALAIYKAREYGGLTLNEIVEWTGSTKISLYHAIDRLIERNYISRNGVAHSRNARYEWSGKFRYPFQKWDKKDVELLFYPSILEFQNRGNKTNQAVTLPPDQFVEQVSIVENKQPVENLNPTIMFGNKDKLPNINIFNKTLLDLQIKSLQAQMDVLIHLRDHSVVMET